MKVLEHPPEYIRDHLHKLQRELPPELLAKVKYLDEHGEHMPYREQFLRFRDIKDQYWAAFPMATRMCETDLLACLFWYVTQRTKVGTGKRHGIEIPYWGVHVFNYPIIIGNMPVGAAERCWEYVDEEDVPIAAVVEYLRIVKMIAQKSGRPLPDVFEDVVRYHGLHSGAWGREEQDRILAHFGLAAQPPPGQRKRNPMASAATDTIPAPPPSTPEPKAKPLLKSNDAEAIREAVNAMIDQQTESVNAGDRARMRAIVMGHLNDVFNVMAALARKYNKEAKERDAAKAAALARNERAEYERAVKFFGAEAPAGGLVDLAPIKKLFRQQSQDLHPDYNPGREAIVAGQFNEVQEKYATIRDYHAKQAEERKAS